MLVRSQNFSVVGLLGLILEWPRTRSGGGVHHARLEQRIPLESSFEKLLFSLGPAGHPARPAGPTHY